MASQEHVEILKKGVATWNAWRESTDIIPDLSNASLRGSDMKKVNLYAARLYEADFTGADMEGANLSNAQLNSANFTGVNFCDATLSSANMEDTKLQDAILIRSNLSLSNLLSSNLNFADLSGASLLLAHLTWTLLDDAKLNGALLNAATFAATKLKRTDFTDCRMGATIFADTDLSEAVGLESVVHSGPSTFGFDSFHRSKGRIPERFLLGTGLPTSLIHLLRSLAENPLESQSCFISFSSRDLDFVKPLYDDLQSRAVRCWFAPENLKIGDRFRERIQESIREYDKLLIVLSHNSVHSAWVKEEVETALERERKQPESIVLFPVRLDDTVMETNQAWAADIRRTRHIGDFRDWKTQDSYRRALDRLLRDLKSESRG